MIGLLAVVEAAALVLLIAILLRRVPATGPPWNHALAALFGGTVLFALVTVGWLALVSSRGTSLARGQGLGVPGLLWIMQAIRLGAILVAAAGWWSIVRGYLLASRRRVILVLAAAVIGGLVGDGAGVTLFLVTVIALRRNIWMAEIRGWRRFVGLLLSPVLAMAVLAVPVTIVGSTGVDTNLTLNPATWPPPLLQAARPAMLRAELALARPLDGALCVLILPLAAQFVILSLQFLSLPVSLRGTSLKRRIAFNYFFIRVVPGFLGAILTGLVVYLGYGLHKSAMVREAFDETLSRSLPVVSRLLDDPVARQGAPDAARIRLMEARDWMTAPGESPRLLLRAADGSVVAHTGDLPDAALRNPPFVADTLTTNGGLLERGGALFLVARRAPADTAARQVEAWVPLDSLYLARLAARTAVDIHLAALPDLYIAETSVQVGGDSAWTAMPVHVSAHYRPVRPEAGRYDRPFYLCRAFLPVGDWRWGRLRSIAGAVQMTLHTSLRYLGLTGRQSLFLISTNAATFGLIFAALLLIGLTESIAVRTGRGILSSVLKEVTALRDAAQRFGQGDLDHRIPVEGKDEIGTVAGALNEMAANLKRQQGELVEKERLEADLAVARGIQRRLLPQAPPRIPGFDVAGVSIPSREVGGDLFYFFTGPAGQLGLALGDVSGKSVPAALLMSNALAALRAQVEIEPSLAAGLARMNRILHDQVEPGRFVTMVLAEIDPRGTDVQYASAGHNPILKVTAGGQAEWLANGGLPLGMTADAEYESHAATLAEGEMMILYSDGVTEAARLRSEAPVPAAGSEPGFEQLDFFDEERLVEVAVAHRHEPSAHVLEAVLAAVRGFCRDYPQSDDITLVVVRRLAGRVQPSEPARTSS